MTEQRLLETIAFLREFIADELAARETAHLPPDGRYVGRARKAQREFDALAKLTANLNNRVQSQAGSTGYPDYSATDPD